MTKLFYVDNGMNFSHDIHAVEGAKTLIKKIKDDILKKDTLPNNFPDYTGEIEHVNFVSFSNFIPSRAGRFIISVMEACDKNECERD